MSNERLRSALLERGDTPARLAEAGDATAKLADGSKFQQTQRLPT